MQVASALSLIRCKRWMIKYNLSFYYNYCSIIRLIFIKQKNEIMKSYCNIFFSMFSVVFVTSLMAFQCTNDRFNCNNPIDVPAKVDSIRVDLLNLSLGNISVVDGMKLKDVRLDVIQMVSPLVDSPASFDFCMNLKVKDTLQDIKIFAETNFNAAYPKGTDITDLYRVVDHGYNIDRPYYVKLKDFIKNNKPTAISLTLADKLELDMPKIFQAKIECYYTKDTFTALSPLLQVQ